MQVGGVKTFEVGNAAGFRGRDDRPAVGIERRIVACDAIVGIGKARRAAIGWQPNNAPAVAGLLGGDDLAGTSRDAGPGCC